MSDNTPESNQDSGSDTNSESKCFLYLSFSSKDKKSEFRSVDIAIFITKIIYENIVI